VKREPSIRFRLAVWYAFVLASGLILFAGLIWISLREALMHEVDQELASRAHNLELFLKDELAEVPAPKLDEELKEFCSALPQLSYLQLQSLQGDFAFSYPENSPAPRVRNWSSRPTYTNAAWRQHAYRTLYQVIATPNGPYALEIGVSLDSIQHVLGLLETIFAGLIPAVILVAYLGSIWLSRKALRPVDAMTSAARAISIDNLSSRLPVPQTGDELQRLAEAWNTMLARLESAINKISQFAADASHELRTPLAIIHTSSELALRRTRTPEQYRGSLQEIVAETRKMIQLVEDLLLLARSDSSSVEMPIEPLDLSEVVQDVCSQLEGVAEAHGIRVRRSFADIPVVVKGHRPALQRLFLVLLDNAIKYSEPGGEVTVLVASTPEGGEVAIKDFGAGIGPQDLPHIFERFYRSDKARTHSDGGYGLGLALAESIARRHQAKITVESSLGKGSEFRVSFIAEQQASEIVQAAIGLDLLDLRSCRF
jgi:two-component system, OmpR family, heavy metal sensor histidine kinase CusS